MFRRQPTSPDSTDASAYSRRAAAADSIWAAQDRLRLGLGGAFGTTADSFGRAFERVAYPLRERLIWPLSDRAATMGAPARALSTGAVVLLAAGAGVAGLIWAAPDGPHDTAAMPVAATSAPLAAKTAPEKPAEPTLHGAAPVFKPTPGQDVSSQVDPAKAVVKSSPADSSSSESTGTTSATAASASSAKPASVEGPPAGPAAISVARDFAGAFVLYETGGLDATVRKTFGETTTPRLARALLKRPPRLPANVEVPKAKVLNVVPSPSHGDVYPVSVSLLRVGLTSELRLEMEQQKGAGWRVTNVLG
jgi:hypothetical protein